MTVYMTAGQGMERLTYMATVTDSGSVKPADFNIDVTTVAPSDYQTMKGFGASLTNAAAFVIYNSKQRNPIMTKLFDPAEGIGLSYIRVPMGGTDFQAVEPYTYDDSTGEDIQLIQFSIDKDLEFIIPILEQAKELNQEIKFLATPWSAPAWMKSTHALFGGRLELKYFQSYANYIMKFLKAYEARGIRFDAMTVQNEPRHQDRTYPTMEMSADEQATFVKDYLGPTLQKHNINTSILIWDHNWDEPSYPLKVLADPGARKYVQGTAWHCYGGNSSSPLQVHNQYPQLDTYFTECSGETWAPNFADNLNWNAKTLFIGQTRVYARAVLLWNLALDGNHGPKVGVGGCQNCRGVVTVSKENHILEVEYYVLGHFSKFVRPGAVRLPSPVFEDAQFWTVAFKNPDGTVVVVAMNGQWWSSGRTCNVRINGKTFHYGTIPYQGLVTFVVSA